MVWDLPDCGPLAEDSATKLKRGLLNVCTVYGVLFMYRRPILCILYGAVDFLKGLSHEMDFHNVDEN